MPLNSEQVQRAYLLMSGRALSVSQAHKKAELLGSREELLAALVLQDKIFEQWPELAQRIEALARSAYVKPTTVRTDTADFGRRERLNRDTAAALERLIVSEGERKSLTDEVHATLQRHIRAWSNADTHPGYQYCVDHEAGA